jgi:ATP-dependent DNA ligase
LQGHLSGPAHRRRQEGSAEQRRQLDGRAARQPEVIGESPFGCEIVEDPREEDGSQEKQGGMMHPRLRALLGDPWHRVPTGRDWFHEIKRNGYRPIVQKDGKRVRLWTRLLAV